MRCLLKQLCMHALRLHRYGKTVSCLMYSTAALAASAWFISTLLGAFLAMRFPLTWAVHGFRLLQQPQHMLELFAACCTAQQHVQSQCNARTFVRCTHGDEVSPDLEGVFREPGSSFAASLQPVPAEQPAAACQALEVLQAALLTSPLCIHLHRTCDDREACGVNAM